MSDGAQGIRIAAPKRASAGEVIELKASGQVSKTVTLRLKPGSSPSCL